MLPKIQHEVEIKTAKTIEEVAEEDSDWETIDDCESEVLENVQVAEAGTLQKMLSCLICEAEMTADHQCEKGDPSVTSNDHTHDVHRPRRLNIVKFCEICDTLHPSGGKCPTCEKGSSPT